MNREPTSLIRMVNQIAANFVNLPDDEAAGQVANHLAMFWAPSMRTELAVWAEGGGPGLDSVSILALARLATRP